MVKTTIITNGVRIAQKESQHRLLVADAEVAFRQGADQSAASPHFSQLIAIRTFLLYASWGDGRGRLALRSALAPSVGSIRSFTSSRETRRVRVGPLVGAPLGPTGEASWGRSSGRGTCS